MVVWNSEPSTLVCGSRWDDSVLLLFHWQFGRGPLPAKMPEGMSPQNSHCPTAVAVAIWQDTSAEKRFGFRLGQLEAQSICSLKGWSDWVTTCRMSKSPWFSRLPQVYFMPDTDITDIGQFRRCYTLVGQGPMEKRGEESIHHRWRNQRIQVAGGILYLIFGLAGGGFLYP